MNVLPLFYPRKTKNAVTCSVTTFREVFKVVQTREFKLNSGPTLHITKLIPRAATTLNAVHLISNQVIFASFLHIIKVYTTRTTYYIRCIRLTNELRNTNSYYYFPFRMLCPV